MFLSQSFNPFNALKLDRSKFEASRLPWIEADVTMAAQKVADMTKACAPTCLRTTRSRGSALHMTKALALSSVEDCRGLQ